LDHSEMSVAIYEVSIDGKQNVASFIICVPHGI
jgi:hypothetical protein